MSASDKPAKEPRRRYRFDPLEHEYTKRRITLAAYGCASIYRAILEQAGGVGVARAPTEKQMRLFQKDASLVNAMTNRACAKEHQKLIASELGADDEALLRRFLTEKLTFGELAAELCSTSERQRKTIGRRFRRACEDLAAIYSSEKAEALSSRSAAG